MTEIVHPRPTRALVLSLTLLLGASAALGQGLTVRSSASYGEIVAPGSRATIFGSALAPESVAGDLARDFSLPRELAGVVVEVEGRPAELAYVSPTQINFIVPRATKDGAAQVEVSAAGAVRAAGVVEVARAAPGIFTANGSGAGPALAFNSATYAAAPFPTQTVELPGCDKRTRLTLLATGLLGADPAQIAVAFTDQDGLDSTASLERAGASETYPGVDEIRVIAPDEAAGGGLFEVRVAVGDLASNAVAVELAPVAAPALDCEAYGQAYVYNTVKDLLAGDLWDVAEAATVFADLASAPADWQVSGVGTTALPARNGELIAAGFAGTPELVWSDPEFPPTVRTLSDEPIPFVAVAAGNPLSVVTAQADTSEPIHQQILDLAQENGLAFAAIHISGRFVPVSYSVAHNLLKEGTPLTDPAADKAPFQLFFTTEGAAEWELSGFYAAAASVQELVSVRGAPVHLHGFQLDRSRAGHIGSAMVENAEIRLYPLAPPAVRDADLVLRNVTVAAGAVSFEALNAGDGTVTRTTVQGRASNEVVFQVELSGLVSRQPRVVAVDLPARADPADLHITIDPFNDVLESDESNNLWTAPQPTRE